MKLALIYNHAVAHTTGAYVERVLKAAGQQYALFGVDGQKPIPAGFDLYLRIDHGDYKFDLPAALRPAVFWAIDTHLPKPYKKIRGQAKHYDVVFCAQKQGAWRLAKDTRADTQWLPLGCDPEIQRKLNLSKEYDIGFVGRNAMKFDRGRHLALLKKRYPNSFIGEAPFMRMSEIYSASRIGFNSSIVNDINMRMFEVISCGCFLLTNRIRHNGLEELFIDGKHLVTYADDRQLLRLVDHYLSHEQERQTIADAGHALVTARHTYYHRVQTMFNYLAYKFGGSFNQLRI